MQQFKSRNHHHKLSISPLTPIMKLISAIAIFSAVSSVEAFAPNAAFGTRQSCKLPLYVLIFLLIRSFLQQQNKRC